MKLKRFESSLPEESFNLVKKAAELSGMTVRSFVAEAALTRAIERMHELAKANLIELPPDFDEKNLQANAVRQKTKSNPKKIRNLVLKDPRGPDYNLAQAQEDFYRELTQPKKRRAKTAKKKTF